MYVIGTIDINIDIVLPRLHALCLVSRTLTVMLISIQTEQEIKNPAVLLQVINYVLC